MHKMIVALVAALALTVAPVAAQEEDEELPEPIEACEESEEHTTLTTEGAAETFLPSPVPAFHVGPAQDGYREEAVVSFQYRLDVSGDEELPHATRGRVIATLDWEEENPGDYNLYVYDADGNLLDESVAFNPLDGPGEQVTLPTVHHCTDLRVDVVNYLAPPALEMTLDLTVDNLQP